MWVVQACGDFDFSEKAFRTEGGGQFRPKDLHRHLSLVLNVLRQVDRGHSTPADFTFNRIAVGQSEGEAIQFFHAGGLIGRGLPDLGHSVAEPHNDDATKEWARDRHQERKKLLLSPKKSLPFSDSSSECNEPFGSRPEPGAYLTASILQLPPGEVPEGRARGVQDTATRVQSESTA